MNLRVSEKSKKTMVTYENTKKKKQNKRNKQQIERQSIVKPAKKA